ncbi:MAG: NAD(P)-binding domain-containing protein [bacterium]
MTTLRAGLIGRPVAHSFSPTLHRAAGESCGVAVDYRLYDTAPEDVADRLDALRAAGLDGVNITAPHKAAAAAWVERVGALTPAARAVGVVNTVVFGAPAPIGDNTDVEGFAHALGPVLERRALLVGAGGAARAVARALLDAGVEVTVVNRTPARAEALRAAMGDDAARVTARGLDAAADAVAGVELVVDALPTPAIAAALPFEATAPGARIVTLRYGPSVEPLRAAVRGRRPFDDGLAMLAWQGIAAFRRWTAREPVPEAVLDALRVAASARR